MLGTDLLCWTMLPPWQLEKKSPCGGHISHFSFYNGEFSWERSMSPNELVLGQRKYNLTGGNKDSLFHCIQLMPWSPNIHGNGCFHKRIVDCSRLWNFNSNSRLLGKFRGLFQPGEEIDKTYLLGKHIERRQNLTYSTHSEISRILQENHITYLQILLRWPLLLHKPQFVVPYH